MVSRGTEDDRAASPLEIMRGDCLRIGATHWEKQLFNGTVVTVEDFKVQKAEAGAEPGVLITAHTEDGRSVSFRHGRDPRLVRQYPSRPRLCPDHHVSPGADRGPDVPAGRCAALAGKTIYPAATRHREALDIYVNRAPLALDIADRRADDDREAPVTDTEIRGVSRRTLVALAAQGGGARLHGRWRVGRPPGGCPGPIPWRCPGRIPGRGVGQSLRLVTWGQVITPRPQTANALARIARDVRRTAFGWRHAHAVASFADGRRKVLAAYDGLRERTRIEGDAVALGSAYRETLTRHAALLKQAEAFPRPAGRLRLSAGAAWRYRTQGPRRLRERPYPGAAPSARGHHAPCASN